MDASEAQAGLEAANAAMADLEKYATGVHASCDFVLDNLDMDRHKKKNITKRKRKTLEYTTSHRNRSHWTYPRG